MISVVLIEPENEENIGSIARVMKNFDCDKLVLINPKVDHLSGRAQMLSTHAKSTLKKAKVGGDELLDTFSTLIGTTAIVGKDSNVPRAPITPEQLSSALPKKGKIALVIGRESSGLNNKEIQKCDIMVTIPASKKYPTMNISHAVGVMLYELFKGKENATSHITPASKTDKDVLFEYVTNAIRSMKFQTDEKKRTQVKVWKRVLGKAFLTKKEAFSLIGFFKKLK